MNKGKTNLLGWTQPHNMNIWDFPSLMETKGYHGMIKKPINKKLMEVLGDSERWWRLQIVKKTYIP